MDRLHPKNISLNAKVAFLGIGSVLITSLALVGLAMWQSSQYNRLAQGQVAIMGIAGLLITVLMGLLGTFAAWTITRPLRQMTTVAESIARGNLDQRMDIHSHEEIGKLAQTFNLMTDRLEQTMEGLRGSEEEYRFIFEKALEGIFQMSFAGHILKANPELVRMFGYESEDELKANMDLPSQLYVNPEDRDANLYEILEHGEVLRKEIELYKKDRQRIWVSISAAMVCELGKPLFIQGFVTDITDQRRAEDELKKFSKLQSIVLDNSTVGIAFVRDRIIEWINPRFLELFEFEKEQVLGKSTRQLYIDEASFENTVRIAYPVLAQGQKAAFELEMHKGSGASFWCRLEGNALDAASPKDGSIWIWEDITDRKNAEKEIRRLNEDLEQRVIQRTTQLKALNATLSKEILDRKEAEKALGFRLKCENLIAKVSADFVGREIHQLDQSITHALETLGSFIEADRCYIGLFTGGELEMHITHEWTAPGIEASAEAQDQNFSAVLPWLHGELNKLVPVWIPRTMELPRAASIEKGYFENRGAKSSLIIPIDYEANLHGFVAFEAVQSEKAWREDNDVSDLLWTASQFLASALQSKRFEEQRLAFEAQLNQAQKLESVGQLAAGIAHEINTPIQYVGDNIHFLQEAFADLLKLIDKIGQLAASTEAREHRPGTCKEIEEARASSDVEYYRDEVPKAIGQSIDGIQRVTKIVRAMKDFSHPDIGEKVPTDINRAIETTVTVARNEWKYVAEVQLDLDSNLPLVDCIASEINQVVLNLIVNAAHAIGEKAGEGARERGLIRITTKSEGEMAEIRIQDTGTGIPESHRARVFDPFFTTKSVGRGTGQGLSIAYNVVAKKHSGTIRFETETGKGTTFIVCIPLHG